MKVKEITVGIEELKSEPNYSHKKYSVSLKATIKDNEDFRIIADKLREECKGMIESWFKGIPYSVTPQAQKMIQESLKKGKGILDISGILDKLRGRVKHE